MEYTEETIEIGKIKELLDEGYTVEVDSPDGWVGVNFFLDKGMWDEYILQTENGYEVICNENHLFKTVNGWLTANDILTFQEQLSYNLCVSTDKGLSRATITKSGKKVPIVDINVDHDNHRYYTNGVESHNTGVGKSLFMCHMAAANLLQGKNVLYITMEMAEEKIAERIDANLLNVPLGELYNLTHEVYKKKVDRLKEKTVGRLIIKEYPTSSAGAGNFRHLLNELKLKKNFTPDIIYIDYLNICMSSRLKQGGNVNSYSYIKAIAEELRGLAVEFNVPIVSATQTNRSGFDNSDIDLSHTSECIEVNQEVCMTDGTRKKIGDVSIGDQITSNDGYKTVMVVHHKKMKDCVRISLKSGKSIVVSKDHIFPTKSSDGSISRISINNGLCVGRYISTYD